MQPYFLKHLYYYLNTGPLIIAAWFFFLVLTLHPAIGQSQRISFKSLKKGLSQNTVTAVIQDPKGFLWVGTRNGLNRYDGSRFRIFESSSFDSTTINDNYITSLYVDTQGTLWIGTYNGLCKFDESTGTFTRVRFRTITQLSATEQPVIRSIFRSGNSLFLGTQNNGLIVYDLSEGHKRIYTHNPREVTSIPHNYVNAIVPGKDDEIILGTMGGLSVFDTGKKSFRNIQFKNSRQPQLQFRKLIRDRSDEDLYWGTLANGGLIRLRSNSSGEWEIDQPFDHVHQGSRLSETNTLSILQDELNRIWVGAENLGLFVYDPAKDSYEHYLNKIEDSRSISSNSIWSLYQDGFGTIWIGTFNQGLNAYDKYHHKFIHHHANVKMRGYLSNNNISTFHESPDGGVWVGTDGGGVDFWDRETGMFAQYAGKSSGIHRIGSDAVLDIETDSLGNLWIATWGGGINIIENGRVRVLNSSNSFLPVDNIFNIHFDKKENLWAAVFGHGLYQISGDSDEPRIIHAGENSPEDAEDDHFTVIFEDSKGRIWAGTQSQGVICINPEKDYAIKRYFPNRIPGSLSSFVVNCIFEDSRERIWIGTTNGLNRYVENTDSFLTYGKNDGIINTNINGIQEFQTGEFWLATKNGLLLFDADSRTAMAFTSEDGVQSNEFLQNSSSKLSGGEILFGGNNGFNVITPDEVPLNPNTPRIYLSDFRIFNKSVLQNPDQSFFDGSIEEVQNINLTHNESVFSFEFIALNFTHPTKNEYAYYMEGFENDWNYVGNTRTATYTNLDPGTYTFRVKASNNDGIWNEEGFSVTVVVEPPFWATWWFRLIIALTITGAAFTLYSIRQRQSRQYQQKLERDIKEQTQEIEIQKDEIIKASMKLKKANDEVQLINEELMEKNEEMMQFTSAVSHDLKSPIASIQSVSDFLEEDIKKGKEENISQYLEIIRTSCNGMRSLIKDIVELAEVGARTNKMEKLNFGEIVKASIQLVHGRISQENIALSIDRKFPEVVVDKNKMTRVVVNLVDNAIKYMGDQKDPRIEVGYWGHNEEGHIFFVKDNGRGIPKDYQDRIYNIFERLQSDVEGTGLGLSMVKRILLNHRGRIWVESEGTNQGSIFYFTLPSSNHI